MKNKIFSDALLEVEKQGFKIIKQPNGEYHCISRCNCCQQLFLYEVDIKETCGEVEIDRLHWYCDACVNETIQSYEGDLNV
ncbi:hypothetical protein [Clostridium rectalis]|uniref:hypothetical protein n=1 Tax=Clostridium rectalis TaxID=2040295 RepID=UPI000F63B641|nr:hypothetical protein [Clostridium rectalis]